MRGYWFVVICLYLIINTVGAQNQNECGPAVGENALIARYLYELWANRAEECAPGGNFITDPTAKDVQLKYQNYCQVDKGSGVSDVNVTYGFNPCEYKGTNTLTLNARIVKCPEALSAIQQPMNIVEIRQESKPKGFTCPEGYTSYVDVSYGDIDFTEDWEFAHVAENAFKYNLTVAQPELATCNSYLTTTIDTGCVNAATRRYFGYATVTAECFSDYKKVTNTSIYVDAELLGASPLEARRACPWPELLSKSPGFNLNFTFAAQYNDLPGNAAPDLAPAPVPEEPSSVSNAGLIEALNCLGNQNIQFVDQNNAVQYQYAKLVWNKLNETAQPLAIAYPKTAEQVSAAVKCLVGNNIRAVPRSGGHSYAGYSVLNDAVTLDLRFLNTTILSSDLKTVTVGGGTKLGPLYYSVVIQALTKVFPAGTCPPVGVGGLLTGGGIGYLTRKAGLSCDLIESLKLVDAKGSILNVNANENADLLWASCGGGGGNFGIIVEYTLKLLDIPAQVTRFEFSVPTNGSEFMLHLQDYVSKNLDPSIGLNFAPDETSTKSAVRVVGMFPGNSTAELNTVLTAGGLLGSKVANFAPTPLQTEVMPFLDFVVAEAWLESVQKPADLTNVDAFEAGRTLFKYKSLFVTQPLTKEVYQAIISWVSSAQTRLEALKGSGAFAVAEFNMIGPKSAVAAVASDATAFPYRNATFSIQYGIEWSNPTYNKNCFALVNEMESTLQRLLGTKTLPAYVNYMDNQVPLEAYYGANFERLKQIKDTYDPENYFTNPMAIPASSASDTSSNSGIDNTTGNSNEADSSSASGKPSSVAPKAFQVFKTLIFASVLTVIIFALA